MQDVVVVEKMLNAPSRASYISFFGRPLVGIGVHFPKEDPLGVQRC